MEFVLVMLGLTLALIAGVLILNGEDRAGAATLIAGMLLLLLDMYIRN